MKKTFEELKAILEKHDIVGNTFAEMLEDFEIPEEFELSDKVKEDQAAYDAAWDKVKQHPYFIAPFPKDSNSEEGRDYMRVHAAWAATSTGDQQAIKEYFTFLGLGEVEEVEDDMDGRDTSVKVFYFKDHDVYIRITGYYSSYDGTDWDGELTEVRPEQKTITVYN